MRQILPAVLLLLTALTGSPAWAQRYLSEFVGTSQIAVGRTFTAIDTQMDFVNQSGVRLAGDFSFTEVDTLGNVEVETYSSGAQLLPNGTCPTRVWQPASSGFLRLTEHPFDGSSFALVGTVDLTNDPGAVRLTTSRLRGPMGFLNPPVDALPVDATEGSLHLTGGLSAESYTVALRAQEATGAVRGALLTRRGDEPYEIIIASGPTWFYLVGVGVDTFIVGRGRVVVDATGAVIAAAGDYELVNSADKALDAGTFEIALTP